MKPLQYLLSVVIALTATNLGPLPVRPAQAAETSRTWSIAFDDAEIRDVANEVLGNNLGLSFTIDPDVRGRMSFRVQGKMSREQLLAAFEATLVGLDTALVRTPNGYLITSRAKAKAVAGPPTESRAATGYRIEAVKVDYATPSEVVKAVSALMPAGAVVHIDDKLGFILVGGTARDLAAVREIISIFDRSELQGSRIRYYELKNAPAEIVAAEAQKIVQGAGATGLVIVPLKRMNSLVVMGRSSANLDVAMSWIERLDLPSREERNSLWLYKARNTSAEKLSKSLGAALDSGATDIGGSSASPPVSADSTPAAAGAAPSSGGEVKVSIDIDSNTLIIAAPASRWIQIQRILNELDAQPDQIMIEATILEVTLNNDFRFGVDWSLIASGGGLTITSSGASNGSVGGVFPGLSITYMSNDARAAITALSSKTNVEVVSSPKLLALNNRPATLQVGDQVPVASQTSQSTAGANSPLVVTTEYKDTGVILKVTPRISGSDTVLIEISQEVSAVARTTSSGIDSPTIQQRRIESSLIVREGQTVALGGLIASSKSSGASGPPLLSDIPFLGEVFKRTTKDGRRTELIVLISATIIRSPTDADLLLEDLTSGMAEMRARGLLDQR